MIYYITVSGLQGRSLKPTAWVQILGSATHQLCDFGKLLPFCTLGLPSLSNGHNGSAHFIGLL